MAREGTVKKWFSEKGYGFITPDQGGEDLFVHYTSIAGSGFRSLEEGERVSYELTRGGGRSERAANVRKVKALPGRACGPGSWLRWGPRPLSLEASMEDVTRCPRCHSDEVILIAYGLPSPEMVEESMAGRLALGGRMEWPEAPDYTCQNCGHEWRADEAGF